jgi:endonuclease YncB( thermonuclease family)
MMASGASGYMLNGLSARLGPGTYRTAEANRGQTALRNKRPFSRQRGSVSSTFPLALTLIVLVGFSLAPATGGAADIVSYAFVQDDGSLKIQGRTVRLFGIYIPPTERTCRTFVRPVKCAPRAVLWLDFEINSRFVRCDKVAEYTDGSIGAYCRVDGEDLGAWLLTQGWALASPEAPFEYRALEKIARTKGVGVWGFPVDRIR